LYSKKKVLKKKYPRKVSKKSRAPSRSKSSVKKKIANAPAGIYSTISNDKKLDEAQRFIHLLILQHEQDRKEISRELHDEISQMLTGVNFQLAALAKEASRNSKKLLARIEIAQLEILKSIQQVHLYAKELRPRILDDLGIVAAIRAHIKDFQYQSDIKVTFKVDGKLDLIPDEKKTAVYRVVQEGFSNIAKHSKATKVWVSLVEKKNLITLKIRNNGRTFDVDKFKPGVRNGRLGLVGMRERIRLAEGTFKITSTDSNGTLIHVTVPLAKK